MRITEIEELLERERTRANNTEKVRAKQAQELKELADELDRANAANAELVRRVKAAESALPDLQHRIGVPSVASLSRRVKQRKLQYNTVQYKNIDMSREPCRAEALEAELSQLQAINSQLVSESHKLKITITDITEKREALERENKQLAGARCYLARCHL